MAKTRYSRKKRRKISRIVGIQICALQFIISAAFFILLLIMNMLPMKLLYIIGGVLAAAFLITLASQLASKKKGVPGKIFGVLISLLMLVGVFYVLKINGAIDKISGNSYKIDKIVVAVMNTDPAQSITEMGGYVFGVQYATGGEDIQEAMENIQTKLNGEPQTAEYASIAEQAEALHSGSVQAIVYNEGYTGVLEEAFEGYSQNVRIVYSYEIKKKLEESAGGQSTLGAEAVEEKPFSVYISGIDVYGDIGTNSRSDVNIVATVNPKTHQILLSTTPRDFYVEIPGVSDGEKDKLTHAGIYGVDASMRTLEQLYDTQIDFYIRVNFTSVVQIIDVLGGVDVYSEYGFTTHPDTGMEIEVKEGLNHFNGEEALAFSRERKRVPGGDIQRGKDQQAVITAIIKKLVSPSILLNANSVIDSVSGNVDTNMTSEQIQTLVKNQLSSGASWNIKSMAASGTGADMYCYSYRGKALDVLVPDETTVEAIRREMDAVENGETLSDGESIE